MNQQNPTDNNHLFHQPSGSSPRYREEASRSWWCDETTREAFAAAAEREHRRMARSRGAVMVQGGIIVGHIKAKG